MGQVVYFDGAGSYDPDGAIVLWKWDFGDESNYEYGSSAVTHTYSLPGIFTVNLWVTDDGGDTDYASHQISVSAPFLNSHVPIRITGNSDFVESNGVVGGTGFPSDPYIIEGWLVDSTDSDGLSIESTDAYFIIRNLYIHPVTRQIIPNRGIYLNRVSNGIVQNSTIWNNFNGITAIQSQNISIVDSSILRNDPIGIGIWLSHHILVERNIVVPHRTGIWIEKSFDITLEKNDVVSGSTGLLLKMSSGVLASRNNISNNAYGIEIDGSSQVAVSSNNITRNGVAGVELSNACDETGCSGSGSVLLTYNHVFGNGYDYHGAFMQGGLSLLDADNVTVLGNEFIDNSDGIGLESSRNVTVSANGFYSNYNGVVSRSSDNGGIISANSIYNNWNGIVAGIAKNVAIFHNNLGNNTVQATSGEAVWDDGYPSGGNYWSDYTGVDNCRGPSQDQCPYPDGIGDTPYGIMVSPPDTANAEDHYPLMNQYSSQIRPRDVNPPSWPFGSNITAFNVTSTSLVLNWTSANDDRFVLTYRIYQGTTLIAEVSNRICAQGEICVLYKVSGLTPGTTYTFSVEAGDEGNNWTPGPTAAVSTLSTPSPPIIPPEEVPSLYQQLWIPTGAVIFTAVIISVAIVLRRRRNRFEKARKEARVT